MSVFSDQMYRKIHLSNTSFAICIKGMTYWSGLFIIPPIGGTPTGCYLGLKQVGVWCDAQKKMKVILNIFSNKVSELQLRNFTLVKPNNG